MKEEMNAEQLHNIRHTLAHLLGAAVLDLYPGTKLTLGPAVDNGFYYDVDLPTGVKITDEDLKKIEAKMRDILPSWTSMDRKEVSADEAKSIFANNEFKHELINEYADSGLTTYTAGANTVDVFIDLCRGGHAENPAQEIDPNGFKLDRVAGAYWRGDEKNKMLTRIYGLAFENEEKLKEYVEQQEEAKKRDHRKLGKELGLFVFSDLVGPGLPLFTPKGAIIRREIVAFSNELNRAMGYQEVHTPSVNKGELFKVSGHYDQYREDMFLVKSNYTDEEYFLKPMNCPQHTQIYASEPRSYRDLPIRLCDFAMLYRDEKTGQLSGLTRLRSFAQDDGHCFCREDQIEEEFNAVLSSIEKALKVYDLNYHIRLSTRDPEHKEKFLGSDATWEKSESVLESMLKSKKINYVIGVGEAAFYGPKMDIIAKDAIGREWQISTIQIDLNMPGRFGLVYTDSDGKQKTPVMIHRALVGSPDRFLGILIEHYSGQFPTWLSPTQVAIVPVKENHSDAARALANEMRSSGIRVDIIDDNNSLGKRIHAAKSMHTPYIIVLGDKEIESGELSIELRSGEKVAHTAEDFIKKISEEIKKRK